MLGLYTTATTLIMDHLLTFLMAFSTVVLKLSISQSLSLHSRLSLPQADLMELWPLIVWQSLAAVVLVSVAGHYTTVILTYLLPCLSIKRDHLVIPQLLTCCHLYQRALCSQKQFPHQTVHSAVLWQLCNRPSSVAKYWSINSNKQSTRSDLVASGRASDLPITGRGVESWLGTIA